jgi:hypothetical protein
MKTFLVERDIGITSATDLSGLATTSLQVADQMFADGDRIHYLGSAYLPQAGRCLCLFTAKNAEVVATHSRTARLPVQRITDAVTLGALTTLGRAT